MREEPLQEQTYQTNVTGRDKERKTSYNNISNHQKIHNNRTGSRTYADHRGLPRVNQANYRTTNQSGDRLHNTGCRCRSGRCKKKRAHVPRVTPAKPLTLCGLSLRLAVREPVLWGRDRNRQSKKPRSTTHAILIFVEICDCVKATCKHVTQRAKPLTILPKDSLEAERAQGGC